MDRVLWNLPVNDLYSQTYLADFEAKTKTLCVREYMCTSLLLESAIVAVIVSTTSSQGIASSFLFPWDSVQICHSDKVISSQSTIAPYLPETHVHLNCHQECPDKSQFIRIRKIASSASPSLIGLKVPSLFSSGNTQYLPPLSTALGIIIIFFFCNNGWNNMIISPTFPTHDHTTPSP